MALMGSAGRLMSYAVQLKLRCRNRHFILKNSCQEPRKNLCLLAAGTLRMRKSRNRPRILDSNAIHAAIKASHARPECVDTRAEISTTCDETEAAVDAEGNLCMIWLCPVYCGL